VAWALGLRNLQIPGHVIAVQGMPYDHARNSACQAALDSGADFLYFLDSDVVPPNDAVLRLMAHNLPIVSGVYFRRSPPLGVPVLMKRNPIGGQLSWLSHLPGPGLLEVDVVGAGCLLIQRQVLEKLPPQRPGYRWFDWRVNLRGLGVVDEQTCLSEDYSFNLHARAHGFQTWVDTSIICRHIGCAEAHYNPKTKQPEFIPVQTVG
jgi:hypothetical protein